MDDRIHQVLDGETSPDGLDLDERRDLAATEAAVSAALGALPQDGSVDLASAVLWRVREIEPVPAWLPEPLIGAWLAAGRAVRWWWAPRAVQLRPAWGLAALLLLLVFPVAVPQWGGETATASAPGRMVVQFRLGLEGASQVALIGDFTGWDNRYALEQVSPGVWSVAVSLEPGVYDYAFVVDGERWTLDPLAPAVADGFGGENSRVAVLAPEPGGAI